MMVNVRVAYINLRSRPERDDAFLRNNRSELDASAFPWRRVDGIDGSQLASSTTEELVARGIIARDGLPEGYEPHTWGHLGAALSHRSLWEQAARSGDDDVLVILEDDAQVCPQFGARLRRVLEFAKNREPWDVVHLGFNTDAPVTIQLDCPRMEIQLICQENGRPIEAGCAVCGLLAGEPARGGNAARPSPRHSRHLWLCGERARRATPSRGLFSDDGDEHRRDHQPENAGGRAAGTDRDPAARVVPQRSRGSPTRWLRRRPDTTSRYDDNRYYAEQFPLAIYDSRPVPCGDTRGYEVHILTCERDRTMAFWALKSFYHYLDERPPLVVHDDGSLTQESFRLFHDHFPGCTVVRADRADEDSRLRESLKSLPLCELWRFRCDFQLAKKLFDFPCLSTEPFIVGIDSDILFFRKPFEILECVESFGAIHVVRLSGRVRIRRTVDLLPRLNSGLFGLRRDDFDFRLVETLLESSVDASPARRFQFWKGWLEQTMLACLFSRSAGRRVLDLSRYQISSMLISDQTISQHFVNDGSRSAFFHWGLRRLDETGFLKAVS